MSTITELAGSGEYKRADSGAITASREFLVYADSNLMVEDVIDLDTLPQIGEPYPSNETISVSSYSIRARSDRANTYTVTYSYKNPSDIENEDNPDVIDGADEGSGVTGFSVGVALTIIDIWKSDPTIPASKSDPARSDIGGTLVSEGWYPISLALPTAEITITQKFSGFFEIGFFINNIGKRNSQSWRGFNSGSVLFTGVDINQDNSGNNTANFKLAFDKFYHLRQVPKRDESGNPAVDLSEDPPTLIVFFKQPFPEEVDFGFLPY